MPFSSADLLAHTEVTFEIMRGRVILKPVGRRTTRGRAAVAGLTLLTRDPRRYLESYPRLSVIAP